jgi:putative ABC transport system permease protein
MIFCLSLRELQHSGRKLLTVLFILSIGLMGPLFASSLRSSVDDYLSARSRQMLSADLAVNAMRPFTPEEIRSVRELVQPPKSTLETEFVTMARGNVNATLVEVKGEEAGFPIFGKFLLKGRGEIGSAEALTKEKIAWVFPEVLAQLGLKVGDSIHLGSAEFKIAAEIEDAPGQGRSIGLAPRIYIGRNFVVDTKLTQFGSQVMHRIYLELKNSNQVEMASSLIKSTLKDPDIFLRTPDDAIQGFDRFFRFFGLYLGAVIMIVFALSWAGAFYILQIFLQDRLKNAAIFLVNGASRSKTGALYVLQVVILMLIAYIICALAVQAAVVATPAFFGDLLPKDFVFRISPKDLLSLAGVTLGSAVAFTAPFLAKLYSSRLQTLLGESSLGVDRLSSRVQILSYAPTVGVFLGLSVWLMGNWRDALQLAGGMAFASIAGVAVGRLIFRFFFRMVKHRPGLTRLIATTLSRSRFGVNLCFLALTLVALAMNIVPHMLKSVVNEVLPIQGKEVPAFFLFNIPESQLEELQKFASEKKVELRFLSPLIQGRLMKVNGEPTSSEQFQKFPVRVSYREKRIPSETLVAGEDFSRRYDPTSNQPAELSVEVRFAERNQLKMGDLIEFDIQGVPMEGKIVSLRKVKWTDFNPNFFIMFQPGVLDDAPKTWLANVNMEGGEEARTQMQFELIRRYPDISVIDVGRTITRVLEIARSVIGPVTVAAWIAVAMSFLILIGIIGHNLRLRYPEVDIQKLLGAESGLIRRLITGEYFATAFFAWLVGCGAALGLAWFVVVRVLEVRLEISLPALIVSWVCSVLVTTLIAWISSGFVLGLRGASRKL